MKKYGYRNVAYSFSYLEQIDNEPEFIKTFSATIVSKIYQHIANIEHAIKYGNVAVVRSELHQLKNYCMIYAFDTCRSKIERVELAIENMPIALIDEEIFSDIIVLMKQFCNTVIKDLNISV